MLRSLRIYLISLIAIAASFSIAAAASPDYSGTFQSGMVWTLNNGTLTVSNPGTGTLYFGEKQGVSTEDLSLLMAHADEVEALVMGPGTDIVPESQNRPLMMDFPNLKSVQLPEGLATISYYAFQDCKSLESVNIPDSVTKILDCAFSGCTSMTRIALPDSIISMNPSVFNYCTNLAIDASEGSYAYNFASSNNIPISHEYEWIVLKEASAAETGLMQYTCLNCGMSGQAVIPVKVGNPDCSGTLGNGIVWYLENGTLTINNPGNAPVSFESSSLADYCGRNILGEATKIVFGPRIDIYSTETDYYSSTAYSSVKTIVLPEDMTSVPGYMFPGSFNLETVSIPAGVTAIEANAFRDLPHLKSINFPATLKEIGDSAFTGCTSLTSLDLSSAGVTQIGSYAYAGCSGLKEVKLPKTLKRIMPNAFANCPGLSHVIIPASVTAVGDDAFSCCPGSLTIDTPTNSAGYQYAVRYNITVSHSFGAWTVVKPATASEAGLREHTCVNCGEKVQENIPKQSAGDSASQNSTSEQSTGNNSQAASDSSSAQAKSDSQSSNTKSSTKASSKTKKKESDKAKAKRLAKKLKKPKLKVRRKSGRNKLTWSKVKYATGYELYIKYPGAKRYVKALTKKATIKSVTHRGLTRGRTYKYKLRAYVKVGKYKKYGPFSKAVSAKVK